MATNIIYLKLSRIESARRQLIVYFSLSFHLKSGKFICFGRPSLSLFHDSGGSFFISLLLTSYVFGSLGGGSQWSIGGWDNQSAQASP